MFYFNHNVQLELWAVSQFVVILMPGAVFMGCHLVKQPVLKTSQPNWVVNLPVNCCRPTLHPPLAFAITWPYVMVTCGIKLFQPLPTFAWNNLALLFQRLIAAHEYFPTCSIRVRFVQKAVGVLPLPFTPFFPSLSLATRTQKFSGTSVGVIFSQWGVKPPNPRQIERWNNWLIKKWSINQLNVSNLITTLTYTHMTHAHVCKSVTGIKVMLQW